jgi:phage-related protein
VGGVLLLWGDEMKVKSFTIDKLFIFATWSGGNIIVSFNGLQKKTQKTPSNEIEKALKIKEAYYADKQSQNC